MAMHVTESKSIWATQTATTSPYNSGAIDVAQFSECIIFIDGDHVSGTSWTPKIQSQDPVSGIWMDRLGDQAFTLMNAAGGPAGDGLNQQEAVRITDLGSIVRLVLEAVGASPEISITATLEGKT